MSTTVVVDTPWGKIARRQKEDDQWTVMLNERYTSKLSADELHELRFKADRAGFTDASLARFLRDKVSCDDPAQLTYAQYTRISAWLNGAIAHIYNQLATEVAL